MSGIEDLQPSTSSANEASTSSANEPSASSANEASTSSANEPSASSANEASTSSANEASASSANEASTSSAKEPSTSSATEIPTAPSDFGIESPAPSTSSETERPTVSPGEMAGTIISLRLENFGSISDQVFRFKKFTCFLLKGKKDTRERILSVDKGLSFVLRGKTHNAQELIKDQEDECSVTLVISNRGPSAFQPSVCGNKVSVVRKVYKNGNKALSILNENGEVISADEKVLKRLLSSLKIHLTSSVLCNEFLEKVFQVSGRRKYKVFLKLTRTKTFKYFNSLLDPEGQLKLIIDLEKKRNRFLRRVKNAEKEVSLKAKVADCLLEIEGYKLWARVHSSSSVVAADEECLKELVAERRICRQQLLYYTLVEYHFRKIMSECQEALEQTKNADDVMFLQVHKAKTPVELQNTEDLIVVSCCETSGLDEVLKKPKAGVHVDLFLVYSDNTADINKLLEVSNKPDDGFDKWQELLLMLQREPKQSNRVINQEFGNKTFFLERPPKIWNDGVPFRFPSSTYGLDKLKSDCGFSEARSMIINCEEGVRRALEWKSFQENKAAELSPKIKSLKINICAYQNAALIDGQEAERLFPHLKTRSHVEIQSELDEAMKSYTTILEQISERETSLDEMTQRFNQLRDQLNETEEKLQDLKKTVPHHDEFQILREELKNRTHPEREILCSNFQKVLASVSKTKAYLEIDKSRKEITIKQMEMMDKDGHIKKTADSIQKAQMLSLVFIIALAQSSQMPFYILGNLEPYISSRQMESLLSSAFLAAQTKPVQIISFAPYVPSWVHPAKTAIFNLKDFEIAASTSPKSKKVVVAPPMDTCRKSELMSAVGLQPISNTQERKRPAAPLENSCFRLGVAQKKKRTRRI